MPRTLLCAAVVLVLSGCAARPATTDPALVSLQGHEAAEEPWKVGDWWDARFYMDLGPGYREEGEGRIVVASEQEDGYTLLAVERDLAVLDYYFDLFFVGAVDASGRPLVEGELVAFFPETLVPGAEWSTMFPVPVFGPDRIQPSLFNLSTDRFDSDSSDGRLRITGTSDAGFFLDLDFEPVIGWFSYVRLTETSTGRSALSVDIDDRGHGFSGPLHRIEGTLIHERLVVTPPCSGPGACDPALANVPPAVTVSAGSHGFAEVVAYLFSFPLTDAGGGAVEVLFTDAEGTPARLSHAALGDRFEGRFFRMPYSTDPQGDWTFQYHLLGTAGAYTAFYGLDDTIIEI